MSLERILSWHFREPEYQPTSKVSILIIRIDRVTLFVGRTFAFHTCTIRYATSNGPPGQFSLTRDTLRTKDPDSDPEFNAGTFVYEKKTKKRGRKSANDSESDVPLSRRNSRRRGGVVQSDVGSSSGYLISCRADPVDKWHIEQRSRERNAAKGNPLLEYFGKLLGRDEASRELIKSLFSFR